jgi:hypothetical protein
MNGERLLSSKKLRQCAVGVFLLLAVFFLPLHYHPANATTSQINNECTCLHGARTQIAVNTITAQCVSPLLVLPHESFERQLVSQGLASFQSIRAPPVS